MTAGERVPVEAESSLTDLERLRQNALDFWRASGAERSSPRMLESLTALNQEAGVALQNLSVNGAWPDVTYNASVPDNFVPHYERLQAMARAWATEGTQWFQHQGMLEASLSAIDFIQGHVNTSTNLNRGNWWWWQIGIPERYTPTLLLLRQQLGAERLAATAATINRLVGTTGPRYAAEGTGNQIWWAMGRIHYGMLTGDESSVAIGAARIAGQIRIVASGEEGLMPDMSFQAHEQQLQTGHYGATFIFRTSEFTQLAEGTNYQLDEARFQLLGRFLLEGARWITFDRFYDVSSEGRAFTRVERNAGAVLNALLIHGLADDTPAREQAAMSARHLLQKWDFPLLPEYAGLAARLESAPGPAAMPSGMAVYNLSDYVIQRREDYFISLKMVSGRTLIGETWNHENKQGRHMASGLTWIQTGDEYRTRHVLPTLDYHRLPGTTVEQGLNLGVAYHYLPGRRSFVTATSSGQRGAAAMDFLARSHNNDSALEAKKSWFFFDDVMVAVGSGITGGMSRVVETIINQRPMLALNSDVRVNGELLSTQSGTAVEPEVSWIHEGAIGYVFPGNATVTIERANQSGKWSDIGSGDNATTHVNPMLTLWLDHGMLPVDAGYAYYVLPNATAAQTEQMASQSPIEVVSRDNALHAVRHSAENSSGVVFWQAGAFEGVTVDQPCVAFWQITDDRLELSVSMPEGSTQPLQLTWPAGLSPIQLPAGVAFNSADGQTVISFEPGYGSNVVTTWNHGLYQPEASIIKIDGLEHLAITYRRPKGASSHGLSYIAEVSDNPVDGTWSADPARLVEHAVDESAAEFDLVTVRLVSSLVAGSAAFLRIRVAPLQDNGSPASTN